jgi:membrane associated rhomboid family serine protease
MFIAIPVGMNYRTERLPIVTLSLIGINTLVHVITMICSMNTGGESNFWVFENLWLIPETSHWLAYLTSMFVHEGIFHLLGNMIFLFLFGCCVEDMVGRGRFLMMYLFGGLIANFVYILFEPAHFHSEIPLGGASGAISACMGMYLLLRADAHIEFKYFFWFMIIRAGEFELPAWVAISLWFLHDVLGMIFQSLSDQQGGGVAFGAHVGGLLAGCAMIGIHKLTKRGRQSAEAPAPSESLIRTHRQAVVARVTRPKATSEVAAIFIHHGGEQKGPYTLSQIQDLLRSGSISQDALYWSDGMADWESVSDLA